MEIGNRSNASGVAPIDHGSLLQKRYKFLCYEITTKVHTPPRVPSISELSIMLVLAIL